MRAKIAVSDSPYNADGRLSRKETIHTYEVIVSTRDGLKNPITVNLYMARSADGASPKYANVWISGRGISCSGTGKASGYGYCKSSQAVGDALASAGVELFSTKSNVYPDRPDRKRDTPLHIGGCGTQAIRDALTAVARGMGYRGEILILG